ncbi:MAG: 30S ribosomal protein S16, partial [bacterium]|nr:30S ribosomal protein S16 [bacterium]
AIKLSRVGKKKDPSYRLLVLPKTKDPWGDFLENVGFYNPKAKPKVINLKADRIKHWLKVGAQPTNTVYNLLISQGIIEGKKRKASKISKIRATKMAEKKAAKEKEEAKAQAPAPEEAKAE